ncbi:unnamed protein product [Candida verbasci]|uniref:Antiviral protein SKI8 n=1 Tax=Candida verbasci TaxID=1227364 RepID=A0A9W4U2D1_9ASCO|nr:unnamed protein product [Candida verbasci]
MGKQYITTVSCSNAHQSDILGVNITSKYSITISSDGTAKFWDNKQDEIHQPKDYVKSIYLDKSGIHSFDIYENILPNTSYKLTLIAFATFNGKLYFKWYKNDDIDTIKDIPNSYQKYWIPKFYKDPNNKQDYLIISKVNGIVDIFKIEFDLDNDLDNDNDNDNDSIKFETYGSLKSGNSSFPMSLAVCPTIPRCAVGYINGEVLLFDFINLKTIYTFRSTDLIVSKGQSSSIPRVLEFSPGGTLLAVARDNQAAGSINLYDVEHGENVGALTTPSHSAKSIVGGFAHQGWILGLSFNEDGKNLVSCGFDKCLRVWNLTTGEREATINLSITDLDDNEKNEQDESIASGVKFIKKGYRGGLGGDNNEGLCVVSFDRGIRWYREAGGI